MAGHLISCFLKQLTKIYYSLTGAKLFQIFCSINHLSRDDPRHVADHVKVFGLVVKEGESVVSYSSVIAQGVS